MGFSKYPMIMVHPGAQAAVNGFDYGKGRPATFPPVEVHNEDQEEMYKARGYVSQGDEASYLDLTSGKPAHYTYHEYPKMIYIDGQSYTVKSKEEEDALCGNNDVMEEPKMEARPKRGRPKKEAA